MGWGLRQAGRISIVGVYAGFTNKFNIGAAHSSLRMCLFRDISALCCLRRNLLLQLVSIASGVSVHKAYLRKRALSTTTPAQSMTSRIEYMGAHKKSSYGRVCRALCCVLSAGRHRMLTLCLGRACGL